MATKEIYKNIINLLDVKRCRLLNRCPKTIPFIVMWITNRCNLRCKICDNWKINSKMHSQELSIKEWDSMVDSAAKMRTLIIGITGGEPFLRKDIFKILERIHKNGIKSHICTNGTLLNKTTVNKLVHSPPYSISVSIDGPESKIHDGLRGKKCFSKVIKGIHLLKEKLPSTKVGINFVMCKKNFFVTSQMVPFAQQLGVDRLNILPLHTNLQHRHKPLSSFEGLLFNKEDISKLKREIKKFRNKISKTNFQTVSDTFIQGIPYFFQSQKKTNYCYAGYISCAIDPFGYVSPGDDMGGVESIRNKKLESIWNSLSFRQLCTKVRKCQDNCWDTTHSELNIKCSLYRLFKERGKILKELNYYLKPK